MTKPTETPTGYAAKITEIYIDGRIHTEADRQQIATVLLDYLIKENFAKVLPPNPLDPSESSRLMVRLGDRYWKP